MRARVLVIGAGVGGLAAAVRLAARGHRVTVLEQGDRPGGKLGLHEEDGFRFDTGPSLVTLPWVLRDLFAAAGERLDDHLRLERVEPVCRYRWPDGSGFDASADLPTMTAELERFSRGGGDDLTVFLGRAARAWRSSRPAFLERPVAGPLDLVRDGIPWPDLTALLPWPTLHGLARRHFRDPRLWAFAGRYATYTGSSPYRAPGTLASVLYAELAFGAWHVRGGLHRIATALERLLVERGGTVEYGTRVDRVVVEGGRAAGAVASGREARADAVVCNADAATLYGRLLPAGLDPRPARLEPSLSGFALLLGVEGRVAGLAHHNVWFPRDHPLEFRRIFEEGLAVEDPTLYVAASTVTDPSGAPDGCENLFLLVNAPPTGRVDWAREAPAYGDLLLERLAARGVEVRDRLRVRRHLTPADLERRYGAWRGGIYGTSSNGARSAFLRPANRAPGVRGLYLASGSAHPGGGLPLAMLSGKLAAEALERDLPR